MVSAKRSNRQSLNSLHLPRMGEFLTSGFQQASSNSTPVQQNLSLFFQEFPGISENNVKEHPDFTGFLPRAFRTETSFLSELLFFLLSAS